MNDTRSTTIPNFTVLKTTKGQNVQDYRLPNNSSGKKSTNEVGSGKKSAARREKPNIRLPYEVGQSNLIGDALKKDNF